MKTKGQSKERFVAHVKKPIHSQIHFTRLQIHDRKRNIVERCRIPNERKNRPPLTPSIASNQHVPKKFPFARKILAGKIKKQKFTTKTSNHEHLIPPYIFFCGNNVRDCRFLNIAHRSSRKSHAGWKERERESKKVWCNLFSHFPFSTFVDSSTRLDYTRFLSRVFPQKNRFACPSITLRSRDATQENTRTGTES